MVQESKPGLTGEEKIALDKLYNSRFRTFNADGTVAAVDFIGSNQRPAFDALATLFNNVMLPEDSATATPSPGNISLEAAMAFSKGMAEIQRIAKQPNALAVEEKGPLNHCSTHEAARIYINTLIETLVNAIRKHYPEIHFDEGKPGVNPQR